MKYVFMILFFIGATALGQEQKKAPEVKLTGFSHPESVIYDEENDYFYVSNMADKTEGDGSISRISRKWKDQDYSWVTGLNDPKGLVIKDDKLYVTDVTSLVEIDLLSGEILRRIPVEGAQSLNDPALDEEGNIYFSDLSKGSIYIFKTTGEIIEWLNSPSLENPNGLLVTQDHILVSAWGKEDPGNFLKIDRATKEIEKVSQQGIGKLDGVQKIEAGNYYISDWGSGNIYRISMDGKLEKVLTTEKSSGDILYLNNEKKLYVPMNHQNEVWIYDMK